ncbi:fructose-bisphosphate aldolase, partial [Bacteroides caccae]|uniref:class I fructose-bisphosphate aldolase n=1 Tax=Bacteroides caccae TaxID=47678 RepID=UPI001D066FD2
FSTVEKRFALINIPSTEETRRVYREIMFTTPGIAEFISGVIFFDETMRHKTKDDVPFPELLQNKGVIPGIKVDEGLQDMPASPS